MHNALCAAKVLPIHETYSNGWANEIHPWYPGFTALANRFLVGLQAMPAFKNRI